MTNVTTPAIYVGTFQKYNNGSLAGQWLTLTDFDSKADFYEACHQLHQDESDPELMFLDWEGCPAGMISESHIDWELIDAFKKAQEEGLDAAFVTWAEYFNLCDYDLFENAYIGAAEDELDYARDYLDETGLLDAMPENLLGYFDYEAFTRDLFTSDFTFCNGFVFSNY